MPAQKGGFSLSYITWKYKINYLFQLNMLNAFISVNTIQFDINTTIWMPKMYIQVLEEKCSSRLPNLCL